MINLTNHPIGTYAKLLIQDSPKLAKILQKKTLYVKDQIHTQADSDAIILTDQQINDMFNGPFQSFFKPYLQALAKIANATLALNLSKGDIFKEKDFEEPIEYTIPEHLLATLEFSTLKQLQDSLESFAVTHFDSLQAAVDQWTQSLLAAMQEQEVPLSDREIEDFTVNEPLSELNNRFIDLKLELPKLKKGPFNFQEYFTLKSTLAIQSALSRSHQASTSKEINAYLQKLKPQLSSIQVTEEKLAKELNTSLNELLKPIASA